MTITAGDTLPQTTFLQSNADGPQPVPLSQFADGKRIVLFGVPGAFTGTCTTAHVPSFMRVADKLRARGVAHIICFAGNDPAVMKAFGEATGGSAAGIEFVSDADGSFARALGLELNVPAAGLFNRVRRNAMIVNNGVVEFVNVEQRAGVCDMSGGETVLEQLS